MTVRWRKREVKGRELVTVGSRRRKGLSQSRAKVSRFRNLSYPNTGRPKNTLEYETKAGSCCPQPCFIPAMNADLCY